MGSVFVDGVEQERAGQSEGSALADRIIGEAMEARGPREAPEPRPGRERPACGHEECEVGSPCSLRRELPRTPGEGVAILCVGGDVPENYYKVSRQSDGRQVLYLFAGGEAEASAYEMAAREAANPQRPGALSVAYSTQWSRRQGVAPVLR